MQYTVHHIAQVVKDIKQTYHSLQQFGYEVWPDFEQPKDDEEQHVRVGVVQLGTVTLELLEPLGNQSPVAHFLTKGGGLHHMCYEVEDIEQETQHILEKRIARQVTRITKSVWEERPVVFFLTAENQVFELIGKK